MKTQDGLYPDVLRRDLGTHTELLLDSDIRIFPGDSIGKIAMGALLNLGRLDIAIMQCEFAVDAVFARQQYEPEAPRP